MTVREKKRTVLCIYRDPPVTHPPAHKSTTAAAPSDSMPTPPAAVLSDTTKLNLQCRPISLHIIPKSTSPLKKLRTSDLFFDNKENIPPCDTYTLLSSLPTPKAAGKKKSRCSRQPLKDITDQYMAGTWFTLNSTNVVESPSPNASLRLTRSTFSDSTDTQYQPNKEKEIVKMVDKGKDIKESQCEMPKKEESNQNTVKKSEKHNLKKSLGRRNTDKDNIEAPMNTSKMNAKSLDKKYVQHIRKDVPNQKYFKDFALPFKAVTTQKQNRPLPR